MSASDEESRPVTVARKLNGSLPFDTGNAILFVKEGSRRRRAPFGGRDVDSDPEGPAESGPLSGQEARQIYEDILSLPEQSSNGGELKPPRKRKMKVRRARKTSHCQTPGLSEQPLPSVAQVFHSVQEGDLELVQSAVSSGFCDVNATDQFHWTLLMCASHAGHMHIVEYLLATGARVGWREHVDRKGQSAADLARLAEHSSIAQLIESSNYTEFSDSEKRRKINFRSPKSRKILRQRSFFCDICKQTVIENVGEKHTTSTTHQFSCQHQPKLHGYGIPQTNRGYQMMLRGGWNPEGGLGSKREGQKYPVKTILKRDRLGFGLTQQEASQGKSRVTHFAAFDESAVKRSSQRKKGDRKLSVTKKRDILEMASKERQWEARMRRYLNTEQDYEKYC